MLEGSDLNSKALHHYYRLLVLVQAYLSFGLVSFCCFIMETKVKKGKRGRHRLFLGFKGGYWEQEEITGDVALWKHVNNNIKVPNLFDACSIEGKTESGFDFFCFGSPFPDQRETVFNSFKKAIIVYPWRLIGDPTLPSPNDAEMSEEVEPADPKQDPPNPTEKP